MSRQRGCVTVGVIGVVMAVGGGALVVGLVKNRVLEARARCEYHLMQLGRFAALPPAPRPGAAPDPVARDAVPPGTVVNRDLPPDRRLSWAADALPTFDRKQQDTAALAERLRWESAWDAGPNADVARVRLAVLTDPGNPAVAPTGEPWPTQYVGLSGVDPGSAELGLGPPVPPRAGCFRYDGPTPFAAIADGLSNTLLFAEAGRDLGPWLSGGPATVRGLSADPGAAKPVGVGRQFGGNHPGGGNFTFADGSVRFLADGIGPAVFRALVTIAGGPDEITDGE